MRNFLDPMRAGAMESSFEASGRRSWGTTKHNLRQNLMLGLTIAFLALQYATALAHETDQYTLPVGREFADLGPYLSSIVYRAIAEATNQTNAAIGRSLRNGPPTRDQHAHSSTADLQSADFVAGQVWLQLFEAFPTNELLDSRLLEDGKRVSYSGLITAYRPEQSIYDDPLLLLDVTKVIRVLFRAATVSVDGKQFGTDKLIHFINVGRIHQSSYLAARKQGLGEWEAVSQVVQLSSGNNLFLSENWFLGLLTTGVRSNADLAADHAGFKFYRNLTEEVRIGNRVMAPMLVRQGDYWRLNDQVHPDSDFFTAFITPHWNEALNPNVYAVLSNSRVRAMLRSRCGDVLDWYRDEHGRALGRRQFEEIQRELATFYGEEYGYEDAGKDTVSVATTCFESEQSSGADPASRAEEAGELRLQNVFGLQSGWGEGREGREADASPANRRQEAAVDQFGRTRLWWAAKDGRVEEVKRLLAAGADPNARDIDGETPLHAAARWGQGAVAELLLSHGADPDVKALYGMTPLQVSVVGAHLGTARALLSHGADANARDMFGKSPLHDAALRGSRELAALLLDYGADPGARDDSGTTAQQVATHAGNYAVVNVLLSGGARPGAASLTGVPSDDIKQGGMPSRRGPTRIDPGPNGNELKPANDAAGRASQK
jgi:ankyrin repeat protein